MWPRPMGLEGRKARNSSRLTHSPHPIPRSLADFAIRCNRIGWTASPV
jgi:hypothetical protein